MFSQGELFLSLAAQSSRAGFEIAAQLRRLVPTQRLQREDLMGMRNNHYDAAFEEFLRARRVPYVFVDERRRALLEHASLKSVDFIVYSSRSKNLLVDVKGRRFPSGRGPHRHKWENWTSAEDIPSLLEWQKVFGTDFRGLLLFAYHIVDMQFGSEFDELFEFRRQKYAFYGVWADAYGCSMRTRSASWNTVSLPSSIFEKLRLPIRDLL